MSGVSSVPPYVQHPEDVHPNQEDHIWHLLCQTRQAFCETGKCVVVTNPIPGIDLHAGSSDRQELGIIDASNRLVLRMQAQRRQNSAGGASDVFGFPEHRPGEVLEAVMQQRVRCECFMWPIYIMLASAYQKLKMPTASASHIDLLPTEHLCVEFLTSIRSQNLPQQEPCKGDLCRFAGHPEYRQKPPRGSYHEIFAFCTGPDQYSGLGFNNWNRAQITDFLRRKMQGEPLRADYEHARAYNHERDLVPPSVHDTTGQLTTLWTERDLLERVIRLVRDPQSVRDELDRLTTQAQWVCLGRAPEGLPFPENCDMDGSYPLFPRGAELN